LQSETLFIMATVYLSCMIIQTATPTPNWSINLGVGDILGIVGILIGIVGIAIAVQQNRKAKSSDEAVADVREQLFKQKAAQRFSDIAPRAILLAGQIRSKAWSACAEVATAIGAELSNAVGFCSALIVEEEKSSLELATNAIEYLLQAIPVDQAQAADAGTIQEMTKRCMVIVYAVERIAGRLKSLDKPENN